MELKIFTAERTGATENEMDLKRRTEDRKRQSPIKKFFEFNKSPVFPGFSVVKGKNETE
jgi:hypothetical protein